MNRSFFSWSCLGALVVLAGVLAPTPAFAQGLYRCQVAGTTTYTDKWLKGKACKAIKPAPPPPSHPYLPATDVAAADEALDDSAGDTGTPGAVASPTQAPPLAAAPRGLPPLPPGALAR